MTHWAISLIGKPWKFGAEGPDEFDCFGFVKHVQRIQYGVELPSLSVPSTWDGIRETFAAEQERLKWTFVKTPVDGDVVMMARNRMPIHIGVFVAANHTVGVLHCFQPSGVVFQIPQSLRNSGWGGLSYYRRPA
jgi:cell wall-associated NlpC family hydrolase